MRNPIRLALIGAGKWGGNFIKNINNRDDIELFFNETGMDIFATSETNIHKNTPKSVFDIPNYRFYHKDRTGNRGGSGIYKKRKYHRNMYPFLMNMTNSKF